MKSDCLNLKVSCTFFDVWHFKWKKIKVTLFSPLRRMLRYRKNLNLRYQCKHNNLVSLWVKCMLDWSICFKKWWQQKLSKCFLKTNVLVLWHMILESKKKTLRYEIRFNTRDCKAKTMSCIGSQLQMMSKNLMKRSKKNRHVRAGHETWHFKSDKMVFYTLSRRIM